MPQRIEYTNKKKDIAVLIASIGSPQGPGLWNTFRYLSTFLRNKRVINIPLIAREILVHLIIIPLRLNHSTKEYSNLWESNEKGFPLLKNALFLRDELRKDGIETYIGMSYSKPFLRTSLNEIIRKNYRKIILIPLFPQYASSTTGVIIEDVFRNLSRYPVIPELKIVNSFYDNNLFLESFAEKIKANQYSRYDHILFSFHSLPLSQIKEAEKTFYDYKKECYETAEMISDKIKLEKGKYSVSFQSSMGKNWLGPFTRDVIKAKAREGLKSLMVVSPSFVSDCLETSIELGKEYKNIFIRNGGIKYQLVESLNQSPQFVKLIKQLSVI